MFNNHSDVMDAKQSVIMNLMSQLDMTWAVDRIK